MKGATEELLSSPLKRLQKEIIETLNQVSKTMQRATIAAANFADMVERYEREERHRRVLIQKDWTIGLTYWERKRLNKLNN